MTKHTHRIAVVVATFNILVIILVGLSGCTSNPPNDAPAALWSETRQQYDARMQWWADARFGLFLHWGLYSIPAGDWNGVLYWAEQIRSQAKIPITEYDKLLLQFNPLRYNARQWVQYAKNAGMKYIIITTKHHDGFCMFDSKETDFDIMSSPFQRDALKELADACRDEGIRLGVYYSIMDWHHPDYLPRLAWETDRPTGNATYERYVTYLKNQMKELLTNYPGISIVWLDGEWESTWTRAYGLELYQYMRSLKPDILINDRFMLPRIGMEGFSENGDPRGDFGTVEKDLPEEPKAGVYWETCIPLNAEWAYSKRVNFWKTPAEVIRYLATVASKGGNFLLGVGPSDEGVFPEEVTSRLTDIGQWMQVNGESIYGTKAFPIGTQSWGCCTQKTTNGTTRIYAHVFDWPQDRTLSLHGINTNPCA